mmetsp:Transcript_19368/g.68543  ORF Transcript_19368/g.68543 Transcript_19368/m.68543 type:complete len:518 (-) Transcript_19368:79-1632(-)
MNHVPWTRFVSLHRHHAVARGDAAVDTRRDDVRLVVLDEAADLLHEPAHELDRQHGRRRGHVAHQHNHLQPALDAAGAVQRPRAVERVPRPVDAELEEARVVGLEQLALVLAPHLDGGVADDVLADVAERAEHAHLCKVHRHDRRPRRGADALRRPQLVAAVEVAVRQRPRQRRVRDVHRRLEGLPARRGEQRVHRVGDRPSVQIRRRQARHHRPLLLHVLHAQHPLRAVLAAQPVDVLEPRDVQQLALLPQRRVRLRLLQEHGAQQHGVVRRRTRRERRRRPPALVAQHVRERAALADLLHQHAERAGRDVAVGVDDAGQLLRRRQQVRELAALHAEVAVEQALAGVAEEQRGQAGGQQALDSLEHEHVRQAGRRRGAVLLALVLDGQLRHVAHEPALQGIAHDLDGCDGRDLALEQAALLQLAAQPHTRDGRVAGRRRAVGISGREQPAARAADSRAAVVDVGAQLQLPVQPLRLQRGGQQDGRASDDGDAGSARGYQRPRAHRVHRGARREATD